ncbi:ABC transporter ATP-binding protein [Promicromonospora panici]|uniref:ABC transporter ATP-binding protein n=1 Tax=Promicromonospora panici TaxID=2219658 RepID=UPI00101C35C4|nr:ABC transporter ATP-binding protein [Promicromonospora panici]
MSSAVVASTDAGAPVELDKMRIDYADGPAAHLDLKVSPGEIVMLLGPSGCGKSTILRALAGLQPIAAGAARIDGLVRLGPEAHCAMVFQEDALLPWRTARRNVEFALALRGVPRRERKQLVLELLDQVGLTPFADHLPKQLSGGMRQRVQLARTLAAEPRVLLMDEPFGALDAQTRLDMQELLISVWRQRRTTILFVTHDVDEALLLADRVVVLTPRPARIARIVAVAHPRDPDAQLQPEFGLQGKEILALLGHGQLPPTEDRKD